MTGVQTCALPISPEEIDKLTTLVQEAVGFKKERGDSVRVVNIPFRAEPKAEPEPTPIYRQPWLLDLLRAGGVPAALTLMALMLLLGVIRPALKREPPPAPLPALGLNAVVDDAQALPGSVEQAQLALDGPKLEKQLADARQMARDNPVAMANLLRGWVNGDAA